MVYPNVRNANLKYWEGLQQVMDAAKTVVASNEIRRRALENNNKANSQDEYDRLRGELSNLKPGLLKVQIHNMMYNEKLTAIGVYEKITPKPATRPTTPLEAGEAEEAAEEQPKKKQRGRPQGSLNKPKTGLAGLSDRQLRHWE